MAAAITRGETNVTEGGLFLNIKNSLPPDSTLVFGDLSADHKLLLGSVDDLIKLTVHQVGVDKSVHFSRPLPFFTFSHVDFNVFILLITSSNSLLL